MEAETHDIWKLVTVLKTAAAEGDLLISSTLFNSVSHDAVAAMVRCSMRVVGELPRRNEGRVALPKWPICIV